MKPSSHMPLCQAAQAGARTVVGRGFGVDTDAPGTRRGQVGMDPETGPGRLHGRHAVQVPGRIIPRFTGQLKFPGTSSGNAQCKACRVWMLISKSHHARIVKFVCGSIKRKEQPRSGFWVSRSGLVGLIANYPTAQWRADRAQLCLWMLHSLPRRG